MKRACAFGILALCASLVLSSSAYASTQVSLPPPVYFLNEPESAFGQSVSNPPTAITDPIVTQFPEIITVQLPEEEQAPMESDSPEERAYQEAEALLKNGRPNLAGLAFHKLGNYKDAAQRSTDAWKKAAVQYSVAANYEHSIGVKKDGTVYTAGKLGCEGAPRKKRYLQSWSDIVAVAAGAEFSVGLKSDGHVVARGINYHGECSVDGWSNVISIAAGKEHTLALKADGRVIADGNNGFGQCNLSGWNRIVAIAAGEYHSVGLRDDGTVVAIGHNTSGECEVSGWSDIVAICAGAYHTVGVKADGTVVATGYNNYHQCDVSQWKDIVSVAAGNSHTLGLKSDGTVVTCGYQSAVKGRHADVSDWTNIVQIACGLESSFGLRSDSQMLAAGLNQDGICNVQDWKDIRLPKW